MTRSLDFGILVQTVKQPLSRVPMALRFLPLVVLVSSCGGSGGSSGGVSNQMSPILQVGMERQYTGTVTRSVVYANPTATLPNNTLEYTFVENLSVQQAASSAPADFDVHADYTYTVVQDPGVGTVPISETSDTYENLTTAANSQTVSSVGTNVVTVSNDETSDALGDGPYQETLTTSAMYPAPRENFAYPLQTGATATIPQSATQTNTFTDVNASGSAPSNGTNVGYTITRTENDDGSYSYQTAYVNNNTFSRTENADGSGSQVFTGPTASTTTTVALPAVVSGVNTIPIATTVASNTTTTTDHSAADWYPENGNPSSPLVLQTRNVVGSTSNLPSECSGAVLRPNIYEIDTTTKSLDTIGASYTTTTTRNFSAGDGASICQLITAVASSYSLLTGALVSTTTTTTITLLNSINY